MEVHKLYRNTKEELIKLKNEYEKLIKRLKKLTSKFREYKWIEIQCIIENNFTKLGVNFLTLASKTYK